MILVVGSTGLLGGQIAHGLLDKGRRVRILVRPASNHQPLVRDGAEPFYGDLKDRLSLDIACRDVDTVITTAISLGHGPADTIESVDLGGNRNLIEAAAAAGVRQFVFTSGIEAAPDSPSPLMAAKGVTETVLCASGCSGRSSPRTRSWTPYSGGRRRTCARGREVVYVGSGARRHSFVHSRDVAVFALAALDHPRAVNRYLPIGGSTPVSIRDTIGVFERLRGHGIPHRSVAPGVPVPGLPPFLTDMLAGQDTYETPWRWPPRPWSSASASPASRRGPLSSCR